jgi:hypothetical protein
VWRGCVEWRVESGEWRRVESGGEWRVEESREWRVEWRRVEWRVVEESGEWRVESGREVVCSGGVVCGVEGLCVEGWGGGLGWRVGLEGWVGWLCGGLCVEEVCMWRGYACRLIPLIFLLKE